MDVTIGELIKYAIYAIIIIATVVTLLRGFEHAYVVAYIVVLAVVLIAIYIWDVL